MSFSCKLLLALSLGDMQNQSAPSFLHPAASKEISWTKSSTLCKINKNPPVFLNPLLPWQYPLNSNFFTLNVLIHHVPIKLLALLNSYRYILTNHISTNILRNENFFFFFLATASLGWLIFWPIKIFLTPTLQLQSCCLCVFQYTLVKSFRYQSSCI